ncbi:hypothetical protein PK35_15360 [Tamlana nanhaiensis]|uniref:MORN repeat protein n=1 Tax=Neotamlana nanhaiensis TaxID=1382798 RepID=A0A0D7VWF3_9FLAO|nr:hypothetical protein [Tamlana nanhaiensis]KJD31215.1 hypothetical protein PK35_15360 [Tamlana nanhaiensis]
MKTLKGLSFLITLLLAFNAYSQKVDFVNAPLNPIAFKYKLEHFNLKGDVYSAGFKDGFKNMPVFSRSGHCIKSTLHYNYENGILKGNGGHTYTVNEAGYITKIRYFGGATETFVYENGLIVSNDHVYNTKHSITKYTYDNKNRLIFEEINQNGDLKTIAYQYNLLNDALQIQYTSKNKNKELTYINTYKNGWLVKTEGGYTPNITTEIFYKFDEKGNPIEQTYKQSNGITNVFTTPIQYYSELEKKNEITFGSVYPDKAYPVSIFRNGKVANDISWSKLPETEDIQLYDVFSHSYYTVKGSHAKDRKPTSRLKAEMVLPNSDVMMHKLNASFAPYYQGVPVFTDAKKSMSKTTKGDRIVYASKNKYYDTKTLIYYDIDSNKAYLNGKLLKHSKTPSSHFFYYKYDKNDKTYFYLVVKGKIQNEVKEITYTTTFDQVVTLPDDTKITLSSYKYAQKNEWLPARYFDATTDIISQNKPELTATTKTTSPCISGNCKDGYGTYEFESGAKIEGFFKNSKFHGYGQFLYANGDIYSGNFYNGQRSGFGTYEWKSTNEQYYGHWKDGKQDGYGYYYKNNKLSQAGIYTQGKLTTNLLTDYLNKKTTGDNCLGNCQNGYGVIKYNQGDVYSGFFKNGKPYKVGGYKWKKNGNFYVGDWDSQGKINYAGMFATSTYIYNGAFAHNGQLSGLAVKTDRKTFKKTYGEFKNGALVVDYSNIYTPKATTTTNSHNTNASEQIDRAMLSLTKLYISTFYKNKSEFKQIVVNQHNNLAQKISIDRLNKDHASLFKRLYQLDKVVAHRYLINIPNPYARAHTKNILSELSNEERTFIREESKRFTSQYKLKEQYVPKN